MTYHRPVPGNPLPDYRDRLLWERCCRGDEPAESLSTRDREDLVYALVIRGWSDPEIAGHTRMTVYTTARIRSRLGLAANRQMPDSHVERGVA